MSSDLCTAPQPIETGEAIRIYLAPRRQRTLDKLQELAEAGDVRAAEVLMKYTPAPRPEGEKVLIPGLAGCPTNEAKVQCILGAVAAGVCSLEGGEKALRMLSLASSIVTLGQVAKDVAELKAERKAIKG